MDTDSKPATDDSIQAGGITGNIVAMGHGVQAIVEHLTQHVQQPFSLADAAEKASAIERRQHGWVQKMACLV